MTDNSNVATCLICSQPGTVHPLPGCDVSWCESCGTLSGATFDHVPIRMRSLFGRGHMAATRWGKREPAPEPEGDQGG